MLNAANLNGRAKRTYLHLKRDRNVRMYVDDEVKGYELPKTGRRAVKRLG